MKLPNNNPSAIANSGWIKLHRKITQWEWYDDANTMRLFIHLLLSANHNTTNWHGITINRAQILTGRLKLAQTLRTTERKITTSLNKLKATNEIDIKTTNKYSIITICNYDSYQCLENENAQQNAQQNRQQTHNKRTTNAQQTDTNKNIRIKELKELKEEKKKECTAIALQKFDFKNLLIEYGFEKALVDEWLLVRKNKRLTNSQTAFESFIKQIELTPVDKNEIIRICITKSWGGYEKKFLDNSKNNNFKNGNSQNQSGVDKFNLNDQYDRPKTPQYDN